AVLQDRERQAGRPAERCGLPGDHYGLLELHGGRRRPPDVRARRRVQLRQGPARTGRTRQPWLPRGAHAGSADPQHHGGGGVSEVEGRGAAWTDAPKGRGADWTEERGTSDEGRRRLKGAPEAHRKQSTSDEGRRRSEGGMGRQPGPRKRAGDTA